METVMSAIERFGHLYEGMMVDSQTAEGTLASFRIRYKNRVMLSDLTQMPEGYEIPFKTGSRWKSLTLLSPPDVIAVLQGSGSWVRIPRDVAKHGPPPYPRSWYQRYLNKNGLPHYFLQAGHRSLRNDTAEAMNLGLKNEDLPQQPTSPSSKYLNTRYPAVQMLPIIPGQTRIRKLVLSNDEQHAVARRFPATNLLKGEKRVLIHPGGFITLDDSPVDEDEAAPGIPVSWGYNHHGIGSYLVDPLFTLTNLSESGCSPALQTRQMLFREYMNDATVIANPIGSPMGLGDWAWMHQSDQQIAETLHYSTPSSIAQARACGMLTAGADEAALPVAIFTPLAEYLDPAEQPAIPGRWCFLTTQDRVRGQQLFARLTAFDTESLNATHVWNLRENCRRRILRGKLDDDLTKGIKLVWVPGDANPVDPPSVAERVTPQLIEPMGTAFNTTPNDAQLEFDQGHGHDQYTHLAHEPFNRGGNDQTAINLSPIYQTRMFPDGKITVDRARARVNHAEPHKLWICDQYGEFKQHPSSHNADWTDKAFIERLNKWREQTFQRHLWPTKRGPQRPDYTQEQRDWVFGKIIAAKGGNPRVPIDVLAAEFNAAFPEDPPRSWNGLQGLLDRLRAEYRQNHGQQKVRGDRRRKVKNSEEPPEAAVSQGEDNIEVMVTTTMPMVVGENIATEGYASLVSGDEMDPYSFITAPSVTGLAGGAMTHLAGKKAMQADADYVPAEESEDSEEEFGDVMML